MIPPQSKSPAQAFTLIELLVAMAVLTMIVVLILRMLTMSSDAITVNARRLNRITAGTSILDRMENDFNARLRNQNLPFRLQKETGNDQFALFSEVQGYTGTRKLAAVQYQITPSTVSSLSTMERGVTGTDWTDLFPTASPSADSTDFEVFSDSPFRMELSFVLLNGQITALPPSDQSTIAAIIVAVALIDPSSQQTLTHTQLNELAGALPDSEDGKEPVETWEAARSLLYGGDIPSRALQNIQFVQRTLHVR